MRYWYGGGPADYVISPGQQAQLPGETVGYQTILVPGVRLWAYDHGTGERVMDLLNASGDQVDHIIAGEYGDIPRFRGPDEVRRLLIGPEPTDPGDPDEDDGNDAQGRWIITTSDWPTIVTAVEARVHTLEQGNGGGGEEPGEPSGSGHPLMWTHPGRVEEPRTSPHPYTNDIGRTQTIPRMRAQATVTSGELVCSVLTIDPDTGTQTVVAAVALTPDNPVGVFAPDATVSDGSGLTVRIEPGDVDDEIADVTMQVTIR
ncbi:hypothetical protein KGD82_16250 [Nocardiopsis eucommiae]|uniref:Uncharacterized protein n=1 Tax=Nocardiopsis eucommiae TaxID=2831970 RepID=A0A975L845_9ACTN|nr:hypothetical protein KGD82_16250 [Nocardiopsis eucommiae]